MIYDVFQAITEQLNKYFTGIEFFLTEFPMVTIFQLKPTSTLEVNQIIKKMQTGKCPG